MKKDSCSSCGKSKANLECGLCHEPICKACTHFLDDGQFSFLAKIPAELAHNTYCEACFNETVASALTNYEQKMEQAKEILVFEKSQAKETRLIKRDQDLVNVNDCLDYDQAVLRLAFFAVMANCNAIIDVDLKSKKVRDGSYQSSTWSGTGRPAMVQADQLVKDRSIRDNPN